MSHAPEVKPTNHVLSLSMIPILKSNSFYKANAKQRKDKSADMSWASCLLRCVKDLISSNDPLQNTERVKSGFAYSEATKYF